MGDGLSASVGLLPQAEVTGIALEFGTVPVLEVLDALRADAWLHSYGDPKSDLGQAIKGQIGWYVLRVNSPDDAVRVAKAIDAKFANSPNETKTETESAFAAGWVKQFGNIQFLILTIGSVVFFTLLLVTGNTMAISVRERTSELAVLKAIGFSGRAVLFFILAESLVIALAGGVLGLSLALLAVPALAKALNGMLPQLVLEPSILVVGLFAALAVGIASGILPGLGAMRMRVVNALRRV